MIRNPTVPSCGVFCILGSAQAQQDGQLDVFSATADLAQLWVAGGTLLAAASTIEAPPIAGVVIAHGVRAYFLLDSISSTASLGSAALDFMAGNPYPSLGELARRTSPLPGSLDKILDAPLDPIIDALSSSLKNPCNGK